MLSPQPEPARPSCGEIPPGRMVRSIRRHALIVLDTMSMKVFVWVLATFFTWTVVPERRHPPEEDGEQIYGVIGRWAIARECSPS